MAVLAVIASDVIHEMLGHGIGCALGGGVPTGWSTSWSLCRGSADSATRNALFQLGGTSLNVLAGAVALGLSRRVTPGVHAWFLWCLGAVQLCTSGAYLLLDPLSGIGDFGAALRALAPSVAVSVGVTVLGAVVLGVSLPAAARGLAAFVSPDAGRAGAWALLLLPWLLGSVGVMCVTAWMWSFVLPQFLAAALWFHGVCSATVLLLPLLLRPAGLTGARTVKACSAYVTAATALAVLTYARLGAGFIYPWTP